MEKVKTSINLDKDAYEYVKDISDKERRSFSQQLALMILEIKKQNIDLRSAQ